MLSEKTTEFQRGEIYFCDFVRTGGSVQDGIRPALIIQNNTGNKYSTTLIVAPMIDAELFNAVKKKLEKNHTAFSDRKKPKEKIFTKRIKCGDCGCSYKMKKTDSDIYWVCSSNGIAGRQCRTHNFKESDLKQAFVRLFNRLKQYENETVNYLLNQLTALKAKISSQSSEIGEIDKEIASLCDKNSMLTVLKVRNIIDDVSYLEQTSELQRKLTELRNKRFKLLSEDEDEFCIEQIRILKNELDSFDGYMLQFNESVFNKITDYITVLESDEMLFNLKCGLKLRERLL